MFSKKKMIQFHLNEDMGSFDDKTVSQVSQFEEMTFKTRLKYGYDNSIKINAGSLCSERYSVVILAIF